MRTLNRNKQNIYYALYAGKSEIYDDYGNATGSNTISYSSLKGIEINVSAARGTSDLDQFGINNNYSRTLVTDDLACDISETSVLWIGYGVIPEYDATETVADGDIRIKDGKLQRYDGTNWNMIPHNHVVVGVAKSLNSITYAIKEVKVS